MADRDDSEELAAQRTALCAELAGIGEFRPGSLRSRFRKCGKPTCHCAREGDPGHGPQWVLTRPVNGKTRAWSIPPAAVAQTQEQVAEYRRFRQLTRDLADVSERLCEARLPRGLPEQPAKRGRPGSPRRRRSPPKSNG